MRDFSCDIIEEIKQRWSPRAVSSEKIAEEEVMALLEAARYAPSAYNEQPWRFILAMTEVELAVARSVLSEANQIWAAAAPVLILILAKSNFTHDGSANVWYRFDSGTAWGFLALEAQRRGLIAHAMAGFAPQKAKEVWRIPEHFSPVVMVAVGKMGEKSLLPPSLLEREKPGERRPLSETVFRGRFG